MVDGGWCMPNCCVLTIVQYEPLLALWSLQGAAPRVRLTKAEAPCGTVGLGRAWRGDVWCSWGGGRGSGRPDGWRVSGRLKRLASVAGRRSSVGLHRFRSPHFIAASEKPCEGQGVGPELELSGGDCGVEWVSTVSTWVNLRVRSSAAPPWRSSPQARCGKRELSEVFFERPDKKLHWYRT
eukprot:COSAG02_NODE_381_length_23450_cov_65.782493_17_plen_181_part_00